MCPKGTLPKVLVLGCRRTSPAAMRGLTHLLVLLAGPHICLSLRMPASGRRPMVPRPPMAPRPLAQGRTSQAASMSLTLPACTAAGVWGVAARAGVAAAVAQLGLFAIFRRSNDPILSRVPGYSAHSALALALMVFCAGFGLVGWLNPPATAATAEAAAMLACKSVASLRGAEGWHRRQAGLLYTRFSRRR